MMHFKLAHDFILSASKGDANGRSITLPTSQVGMAPAVNVGAMAGLSADRTSRRRSMHHGIDSEQKNEARR